MTATTQPAPTASPEAVVRGEVDFRIVMVTTQAGPVDAGVWASHSLATIRGDRGHDLSRRARNLFENLAGKRANLRARHPEIDTTLRHADQRTWAKLLMLATSGVPGYEMECF